MLADRISQPWIPRCLCHNDTFGAQGQLPSLIARIAEQGRQAGTHARYLRSLVAARRNGQILSYAAKAP